MKCDDDNEIFPVVDSEGNVLGKILRGEAHDEQRTRPGVRTR